MITTALISALEGLANRLIKLDPVLSARLQKLHHQVLVVHIRNWQQYLSVQSHEQGMALQLHSECPSHSDCFISADTDTLIKLKDPSLLTQLIRQEKLDLEGDIHLAQAYSSAFSRLDIDWAEHWSRYLGDAPAQWLFNTLSQSKEAALTHAQKLDYLVSSVLQDELKVAIHPLEHAQFSRQNQQLRNDVEQLSQRINQLLAQHPLTSEDS